MRGLSDRSRGGLILFESGGMMDGAAAKGWIGRAMVRREDARLLTGRGRFVADLIPPGCQHVAFLRSPYPGGRITVLDVDAARGMPGVRLVLTGDDLAGLGAAAVNPLMPGARLVPMIPLARGHVAAVGQAVAAVVADTALAARDAVEAIVFEVDEEAEDAAPVLVDRRGVRVAAQGMRVAARVVHSLVAPMALEPRAVLAAWEGGLTVWLSTQTPQRCRDDLAAMLGLARGGVRVVAPDVGGAFGGKASLMPEDVVCAFAARRLGGAVAWVATRGEEFEAATQGRGAVTSGAITVSAAGVVAALEAEVAFRLGHWMPYSALAPVRNAGRILPGPYAVPEVDVTRRADLSAGAAVNIYRGAGRPEAAMLLERLMDKAAAALALDPIEMRRRNIAGPGVACSGDFAGLLDRLVAVSKYDALRAALPARRAAGVVCGLGVALYVEPCGQGWETAEVRLAPDGRFTALSGSSAQGQGRETALAQIVAEVLGIDPALVTVVAGDSAAVPDGIGALASRSTAIGGSAMVLACRDLAGQMRARAAAVLGCDADAVVFGPAGAMGAGRSAPFAALAGDGISAHARYEAGGEAWASGAVLAAVAVDADTGALTIERIAWVDDAGTVINPMLVEGQLMGGLAQGIGAAVMERVVYDGGQLLTGSLMDYAVPRAADMPPLRLESLPTRSPANVLGAKGVGEAGCIGVPAAILNAVQDALAPFGAPDLSLPLTSEKLWRVMKGLSQ